jgi:hypothetical protein
MGPEGDGLTLTADQARRGVRLARWACFSTLAMMQGSRQARRLNHAQTLLRLVTDAGGKITLRILRKAHGYDADEVKALARDYPRLFMVQRIEPGEKGGRPSEILTMQEGGKARETSSQNSRNRQARQTGAVLGVTGVLGVGETVEVMQA